MTYDEQVNNEDDFEDRIFIVNGAEDLHQRITEGQAHDEVIQKALREFAREGRVVSGQLKNISKRLRVNNQVLYFMGRIVVPTTLRQDTLRLVHAQHHLGQAGTLHSLRRCFFWPRMARSVKVFCNGCVTEGKTQIQRKSSDEGNEDWTRKPGGGNGNGHRYTAMDGLPRRGVQIFPPHGGFVHQICRGTTTTGSGGKFNPCCLSARLGISRSWDAIYCIVRQRS